MGNRFKIPVPVSVRWGNAGSYGQPTVGGGSKHGGVEPRKIRAPLTLKCDGERRLRTKELVDALLPRKASKLQLILSVPQSDTGRRGE
jgi:hypothetical protein